ncbi:MAG: hypothetical protein JXB10_01965 [Pirellulales bacterium]|nr:hypothetical protein [Pirellulales bacterium]
MSTHYKEISVSRASVSGSATCYWDSKEGKCKVKAISGKGIANNSSVGYLWTRYIGAGAYAYATVHDGSTKATFDVGYSATWGAKVEISGSWHGFNLSHKSSDFIEATDKTTITITCKCVSVEEYNDDFPTYPTPSPNPVPIPHPTD